MNEKFYVISSFGRLCSVRAENEEEACRIANSYFVIAVCDTRKESFDIIHKVTGTGLRDGETLPLPCIS